MARSSLQSLGLGVILAGAYLAPATTFAQTADTTVADVTVVGRPDRDAHNVPGRLVDVGKLPSCSDQADAFNDCEQLDELGAMLQKAYSLYDAGDQAGALAVFRNVAARSEDYHVAAGYSAGAADDDSGNLTFNPDSPGGSSMSFLREPQFMRMLQLRQSARALTREAALMNAELYLNGDQTLANGELATHWLKRVAMAGVLTRKPQFNAADPNGFRTMPQFASIWLASLYRRGDKIERDLPQSLRWYEHASKLGYVPAFKALGDIYAEGAGVARNTRRAAAYYKRAADLGFMPAKIGLARLYMEGGPADKARAIALYQEAARGNDVEALYALALAYEAGDGAPADPQRAVALYRQAADAGDRRAQLAYGLHLYEGSAAPKNQVEARKWLNRAAAGGEPEAIYNLAVMTAHGEGGEKDMAKAWVLMKVAQAAGQPGAASAVAVFERRMTTEERAAAATLLAPGVSPQG